MAPVDMEESGKRYLRHADAVHAVQINTVLTQVIPVSAWAARQASSGWRGAMPAALRGCARTATVAFRARSQPMRWLFKAITSPPNLQAAILYVDVG